MSNAPSRNTYTPVADTPAPPPGSDTTEPAPSWRFVLATDLDGTFLGGTQAMRASLYRWIAQQRQDVGLIFVTGRDPDFIVDLCARRASIEDTVPTPDYVVADVGTTLARMDQPPPGEGSRPVLHILHTLEAPIAEAWGARADLVRRTLARAPGLKEQETAFRHRVSYHCDPEQHDPTFTAPLEREGLDILLSHGCFLDVLPGGVNKGSTLLRLMDHLGIARSKVLVAGDTLNDLSMFQTGLHGAVVGGAESGLLAATCDLPHARQCQTAGAGGIAEAIAAFQLHPEPPETSL
ncbi:MAG: HAD family hydrolase [Xanthobacter sp.]